MKNKLVILLLLFSLFSSVRVFSQSQAGAINGTVSDTKTKETLGFATVVLFDNGVRKTATPTDINGYYEFKNLEAGNNYSMKVSYVGYGEKEITGIIVTINITTKVDVQLSASAGMDTAVTIIGFKKPLFEGDVTTQSNTLTAEDISHVAYHNVNEMIATSAGVFSQDGSTPNIKGNRTDGTVYYVDGVAVVGSPDVPQSSIEQLSVLTGGIPAEYGNSTGGVITITTKGPAKTFSGGFDGMTSEYLDPYGYTSIDFNLTGPIWMKHKGTDSARPIMGYYIGGNYLHELDQSPSAIPIYQVKPYILSEIDANPLSLNGSTSSYLPNADFVTLNNMQTSAIKPNSQLSLYDFTGKLDFQPTDDITFYVGGQIAQTDANDYIYQFSLFNAASNPEDIENTYRAYANYRQTFKSAPNAVVTNAYYSVHFDFSDFTTLTEDPNNKGNLFNYGYVGQFKEYQQPEYIQKNDTINGKPIVTNNLSYYLDTLITFTPGKQNPILSNYTEDFFKSNNNRVGYNYDGITSLSQIQNSGALLNGDYGGTSPAIVYSLWNDVGDNYPSYSKTQYQQYTLNITGGASIKKHDITFGIQYQQYEYRYYSINADDLWGLMRQLEEQAVPGTVDLTQPALVYDAQGHFTNVVNYPLAISDTGQSTFSKSFQQFLVNNHYVGANGQPVGNGPYPYNIDQYQPKDFNLGMFSANDLLNNGNAIVSYEGYNFLGNKTTGKITYDDFFNSSERLVAPFAPTYTAGYIEDKFEFKDLICRLGLRVDRYDGNQDVLVDPWSLYPEHTAAEVATEDPPLGKVPSDIGGNYIVYVDNAFTPTKITGYRNGSTWYNAAGNEISDPSILAEASSGGATVQPWLIAKNSTQAVLSDASFTSYTPAVTVQPRISFSFPISEDAVFYANYDVLTQQPKEGNVSSIEQYYFINENATGIIANPNLQPTQRINYEVGFKQKLTTISAIELQAFYGEMRNLEEIVPYNYAYPIPYVTYGNIDFGTVKGLTAVYDLRRPTTSGVQLQINYTLQFANGTGSDATSQATLIQSGQPNLRVPFPLDFDVRHQISATLDYRFGDGANYSGPSGKTGKKIFKNLGFNVIGSGRSGTPYSQQANVTETQGIGIAQRTEQLGGVNAARLPWQFKLDAKIDKAFSIDRHSKKVQSKPNAKPPLYCDVYLSVQNVLNTLNVIGVYRYTGSPSDDGFLNSTVGAQTLAVAASQQALIDQYNVKVNSPFNYAFPRLIRLGLSVNF